MYSWSLLLSVRIQFCDIIDLKKKAIIKRRENGLNMLRKAHKMAASWQMAELEFRSADSRHECKTGREEFGSGKKTKSPYGHQPQQDGMTRLVSSGTKCFGALFDNAPERR